MDQILESLSALLIPIFDAEGRLDTLGGLCWCVFIGVVLVFISVLRQNATLGKAIRKMRAEDAVTEDKALPLSELGKLPSSAYKGNQTLFAKVEREGKTYLYLPEKSEKKADFIIKSAAAPLWLMILELIGLYAVLMALHSIVPLLQNLF